MQFEIKRDILLRSLNYVQGVVEKKNTLPILSNVLLELKGKKLSIVATDLDIIFYDEISELKDVVEGNTTITPISDGTESQYTLTENHISRYRYAQK